MSHSDVMDPGHRVFVYGTLRRGASNHHRMAGAVWVGRGTIRARLYRVDWFPGLIPDPAGELIVGEVYEVSTGQMEELDRFEGVAAEESCQSEYLRVAVEVTLETEQRIAAWVWQWNGPVDEARRLRHGDWLQESPTSDPAPS